MNIGPVSLPIGLVIFFLSIAAAIFAGYLSDKKSKGVEPAIFYSTLIGLIVARISFVLHYLPSYDGSLLKMIDFRDADFDMFPGVAAGIVVIAVALATAPLDASAEPAVDKNVDVAAMHADLSDTQKAYGGAVRASNNGRRARSEPIHPVAFEVRTSLSSRPFTVRDSQQAPALRSTIAYMVDQNTGESLVDKNSLAVVPIASVTKLMTAMVVLDSKAQLSEAIEVTDEDRDIEKHSGSRLSVGSKESREDMLHIALMASENRAAAALSRYYPGGRPAFIAAMNQKARSLGMTDTHFENPTGLSKLNVSSARDLVKMVEAAYQYRLIREFSTDAGYRVSTGKGVVSYHNTNILVHDPRWDIGLQKTGFINESGICLVMQATIQGRPVVMVLLDSVGRHADFADAGRLRAMLTDG